MLVSNVHLLTNNCYQNFYKKKPQKTQQIFICMIFFLKLKFHKRKLLFSYLGRTCSNDQEH